MATYNEILNKVSEVLDEKDVIEKIMLSYFKKTEKNTEHLKFIEERVRKICE